MVAQQSECGLMGYPTQEAADMADRIERGSPRIGDRKWGGHSEWRWNGIAWEATGIHAPGWTNTPRAGESEGSRDRKPNGGWTVMMDEHIHDACIVDAKVGEPPLGYHHPSLSEKTNAILNARLETDSVKRKDVNDVLNERENTHGNFGDNARISQATKALWRAEKGWERLDDDMREVLEMEALKIGRILSGNPNEPDHWLDNSGYPAMIANRLKFGTHKV